jgi:Glycosyl transferase family 2
MITGVLTSCNRYDLLHATLESFFQFNTAPLMNLIVVEDGPDIPLEVRCRFSGCGIEWISTGRRVGQIAAIDYAYSRVKTPYIFHMEDDWQFYRSGFIEKSIAVLESNPKCLQVWIRATGDTQGHPVEPYLYRNRDVGWQRLALQYRFKGEWHGFSLNPGLRRFVDYVSIGGYGAHTRFDPAHPGASESAIGKVYRQRDFFAAILCDDAGAGYIRHIGWHRHVGPLEGSMA